MMKNMSEHIVLLGDSVFDNRRYVGDSPDVITYLRQMLPEGYTASLYAVDGDKILDIKTQIRNTPEDVTRFFISVGGNDALENIHLLSDDSLTGPETLKQLAQQADSFYGKYSQAIDAVLKYNRPTYLFTIYNGDLDENIKVAAKAAVSVYNDRIYSAANKRKIPVVELRGICNQREDFVSAIEPSAGGGKKIAAAICRCVLKE